MGGKQKGQRTKGNVRPSNSGRAAELLSSSNASAGFSGFEGLSTELNYPPVGEEFGANIDGDFCLVMRKMKKKDATTKLKAVQEFSTLCSKHKEENLKNVLPFWPRLYNKLSLDHDRRVREATQLAHKELIQNIRRNLAPHLRSIMACWLMAQCDPFPPAANAAYTSFQSTFPLDKQRDAILFCKKNIIATIEDNLFHQTPDSLSDVKAITPEEMESKYHRVLYCSLLACKRFLNSLPQEEHKTLEESYNRILGNPAFWKLVKIDSSLVKGAFFSLIATVCQVIPEVAKNYAAKLCPIVLGCIDTSDVTVSSQVWEAVMYVILTMEDWNEHVNIKKALLPKLWIVLQNGGYGFAVTIFPALLPLLNKFRNVDVGDENKFYQDFFDCLKEGLSLDKVRCSVSEYNAIVKAFMECFHFVTNQTLESNKPQNIENLILDQLLVVIEATLKETNPTVHSGVLYTALIEILNSWNNQTECENSSTFTYIQDLFWNTFQELCLQIIDISHEESKNIDNLLIMIGWLGGSQLSKKFQIKKKGIRFSSDSLETPENTIPAKLMASYEPSKLKNNKYFSKLTSVLTEKCYENVEKSLSLAHIKMLNQLFWICKDLLLCKRICNIINYSASEDCDYALPVLHIVLSWITKCCDKNLAEHIKILVDLVFGIYNQVTYNKKSVILNELCQNNNSLIFCCFLEKLLELYQSDALIQSWLKDPVMSQRLIKYIENFCHENLFSAVHSDIVTDLSWRILRCCLSTNASFEPYISSECMDQIINTFHLALPKPGTLIENQEEFENCITFVCNVAVTFFTNCKGCLILFSAKNLLLTLFEISCQSTLKLQDSVKDLVQDAWRTGLKMIALQTGIHLQESSFISQAISHIKHLIFNCNMTSGSMEKLLDIVFILLQDLSTYSYHIDMIGTEKSQRAILTDSTFQMLLNQLLPTLKDWNNLKEQNNCQVSIILPKIILINSSKNDSLIDFSSQSRHYIVAVFSSSVLLKVVSDCEEPLKNDFINHHCNQLIDEVTYALATCDFNLFLSALQNKPQQEFKWSREKLQDNLNKLLFLAEEGKDVLKFIWEKSRNEGILQYYILRVISQYLLDEQLQICFAFYSQRLLDLNFESDLSIDFSCLNLIIDMSANEEFARTALNLIMLWKDKQEDIFSGNYIIKECDSRTLNMFLVLMQLMKSLVDHTPKMLDSENWDFILCQLVFWIQTCCENGASVLSDLKTMVFFTSACNLLHSVSDYMDNLEKSTENEEKKPELVTDWKEFFSEGIYSLLLPKFLDLYENVTKDSSKTSHYVLENCGRCLTRMPVALLKTISFPSNLIKLLADDYSTMPNNLQTLLNHFCPMLISPLRFCRLSAFQLLFKLSSDLPSFYSSSAEDDDKDPSRSIPLAFKQVLDQCELQLSSSLDGELHVGVCHPIEPKTHTYVYTSAYLLLWKLLLQFFDKATAEMRAEYTVYLKESDMVSNLHLRLFCLMPENPLLKDIKNSSVNNIFNEDLVFNFEGSSAEIQHVACSVFYSAVKYLPLTMRQWWNNQEKSFATIIEKFTSKYVSPLLCNEEIQRVKNTDTKIENMVVKARPAAREVVATYNMGDISMDLIMQLPLNYPLGPISLEGGRHVGVAANQWRNWMLQLMTFLTHQNGSILDGLILWKRNVDKQFEGIEDCMICYSVIHGTNCQLPKLICRTCKKRFHAACLYKWFNTSNNSSCPLCRSLF